MIEAAEAAHKIKMAIIGHQRARTHAREKPGKYII